MSLKLMYITNNPNIAKIADNSGVDRIFVDLEYIGKELRQKGMDTVQNFHTIRDIASVKNAITTAELLVRINPIHSKTEKYLGTKNEIDMAINAGADILMLPFFTSIDEAKTFINLVDGRVKTILLIESKKSVEIIDEILELDGIDEVYIGLNDLSIDMGKSFMFELIADGTVEVLCAKFKRSGIPYGFGGIADIGKGLIPSEYIIKEHYRLGSSCAILSRSFCNTNNVSELEKVNEIFFGGINRIRSFENICAKQIEPFRDNEFKIKKCINEIINR